MTVAVASFRVMHFAIVTVNVRMSGVSYPLNVCLESGVLIGGVLNDALRTVSIVQRVLTLYDISIPMFPLILAVTCVEIFHSVFKFILWMRVIIVVIMFSAHGQNCESSANNNGLKRKF